MTSTPATASEPALHVLGALALELRGDAPVVREALAQDDAGRLAEHLARDLAGFDDAAASLDLVTVGAHYDPVEVLRAGWPLHRELDALAARAPGRPGGRLIAFGAHDDRLPGALAPQPAHRGGPLRLVPFVLGGDPAVAARVGDAFETALLERGMAGAATALYAQEAFGLAVEHARYLTVHDLAAMTALQYEHAGIGPLWPVLEAALLAPESEAWLDAPPEPLVRYAAGEARIALFAPAAWKARYAPEAPCETDECRARLAARLRHFEARQRQVAAVLGAHGVPVEFVHVDGDDARAALG